MSKVCDSSLRDEVWITVKYLCKTPQTHLSILIGNAFNSTRLHIISCYLYTVLVKFIVIMHRD